MQLMKDELDDACLVLNTGMQVSNIKWNSNGSVLAVSGVLANSSSPAAAVIQFYSCYGKLCVDVKSCQWRHALLLHTSGCKPIALARSTETRENSAGCLAC